MDKIYNKLVRDKIPDIIKGNGENPVIKVLKRGSFNNRIYLEKVID